MKQRHTLPSREQIALLPAFAGLGLQAIACVANAQQAEAALQALLPLQRVGFDTESKPTFLKDEISGGPHTVQFASPERAWVFQLHDPACRDAVVRLLQAPSLAKFGFGLGGDRSQIQRKLGVEAQALYDLDSALRERGYRREVGVKAAIALVFEQRFGKSRKQTTSNWAVRQLSPAQLLYAANDAYAALRVADALAWDPALTQA